MQTKSTITCMVLNGHQTSSISLFIINNLVPSIIYQHTIQRLIAEAVTILGVIDVAWL